MSNWRTYSKPFTDLLGVIAASVSVIGIMHQLVQYLNVPEALLSGLSLALSASLVLYSARLARLIRRKSAKRIFVSYSQNDKEIAAQLSDRLKSKGAFVWLDTESVRAGSAVNSSLQSAIKDSDYMVVIYSGSVSPMLDLEVGLARESGVKLVGAYSVQGAEPPDGLTEVRLVPLRSKSDSEKLAEELV